MNAIQVFILLCGHWLEGKTPTPYSDSESYTHTYGYVSEWTWRAISSYLQFYWLPYTIYLIL